VADEGDTHAGLVRSAISTPERHAELVLKGVGIVPAAILLAVADEIRRAVARLDVADVSVRVSTRDTEPVLPSRA